MTFTKSTYPVILLTSLQQQDKIMINYLVTYTYITHGANFAEHWKHQRVSAPTKAQAIAKARRTAPSNARYFKAHEIR